MDIEKLKEEQKNLSKKVLLRDENTGFDTIAGIDVIACSDKLLCGIVVIDLKTSEVVDKKYALLEPKFPYMSGFLSYRESPVIIEAYNKLRVIPDLVMIKGNGILHPRKFGLASHVGLLINKPTIGIAKKLLCGVVREGDVYLDKEIIGKFVKVKDKGNPIIVSPGHMISLHTSVELTKKLSKDPYKTPYPLALAHKYANKIKDQLTNIKPETKDENKLN